MIQSLSTVFLVVAGSLSVAQGKVPDRSRVVKARYDAGKTDRYHDNGRPIEGQSYRSTKFQDADEILIDTANLGVESATAFLAQGKKQRRQEQLQKVQRKAEEVKPAPWQLQTDASTEYSERRSKGDVPLFVRGGGGSSNTGDVADLGEDEERRQRNLSSQLTGCCYNYQNYYAADLCALYGHDCESGETPSHDSGDESCQQDGLSFIGISFSVNTASGNPYSYQLCDQFPMENIIDRDYDYVMSMDEDGWLVGGGYKTFDYSGKMP